jgi:hypothetical protein
MNQTVQDLRKAIIVALAGAIAEQWERIVVNYEMQEEYGGLTEDRLGFYILKDPSGEFHELGLKFTPEVKGLFRKMNDEMQRTVGERWGTCDLVVDQPGQFNFNFSYDPPKRINGVFDENSMGRLDRYLETYKTEQRRMIKSPHQI